MPWEKSFDENLAIDKATEVFWDKGYNTTSISDLLKITGLNRGSLYNAFGGKHQMFVQSLLKYDTGTRKALLADLEQLNNPKLAIETFFDRIIRSTLADTGKKGCFLINTSVDFNAHGKDVQEIVTQGFVELEQFFKRNIEAAQAQGHISAHVTADTTAKALLAMLISIRILGRSIYDEKSLTTLANQAKQLINEKRN